jgi:hypothetical protein
MLHMVSPPKFFITLLVFYTNFGYFFSNFSKKKQIETNKNWPTNKTRPGLVSLVFVKTGRLSSVLLTLIVV